MGLSTALSVALRGRDKKGAEGRGPKILSQKAAVVERACLIGQLGLFYIKAPLQDVHVDGS